MKWVVAVIVLSIALYTVLTLKFRKPGPAFEPYQDTRERATTARLLAGGWKRLPVTVNRPVEKPKAAAAAASTSRDAHNFGPELDAALVAKPPLLERIDQVVAPADVARGEDYLVQFTGSLGSLKSQVGDVILYRHADTVVLIPATEPLPGEQLLSRFNGNSYALRFATATLPPGRYHARLVAQRDAVLWSFTVR